MEYERSPRYVKGLREKNLLRKKTFNAARIIKRINKKRHNSIPMTENFHVAGFTDHNSDRIRVRIKITKKIMFFLLFSSFKI